MPKGEKHPMWKGGRLIHSNGYVLIYNPTHPHAKSGTYVYEHRLIMENEIGRYLLPSERVHHINHDKQDNRIENLQLFKSHSEHLREEWANNPHYKGRWTSRL